MNSVEAILKYAHPAELVDALLKAYETIERNFRAGRWKASELDGGHFVEAARRMLDHELTGTYLPIGKTLPGFSDSVLKGYERCAADESLRMLIPRSLWALYAVRNKRGVAHLSPVSPNAIDAALILSIAKWVLAELVRLKSGLSPAETELLIGQIVQRDLPVTWEVAGTRRVLTALKAKDEVLVHLYHESPQTSGQLRAAVEYGNPTRFRGLIRELHRERLIEATDEGECHLSPLGEVRAEALILPQT